MDKKKIVLSALIGLFALTTLIVVLAKSNSQKMVSVNPAFKEYVSGFTSGVISTESTIRVRLANDLADSSQYEKAVDKKLFSFSPALEGSTYWIDSRTLEFRPERKLKANTLYTARFFLSELMEVPDSLKTMVFQFHTIKQAFEVNIQGHKCYDNQNLQWEKISGTIVMADVAEVKEVAQLLSAKQDNRNLTIKVIPTADNKTFQFVIDSVSRFDKASEVSISWNGKPIDAENKGNQSVIIPSIHDFILTSIVAIPLPDPCIHLQFSDPLMPEQELAGIIKVDEQKELKFMIEDNQIFIYPGMELGGDVKVIIEKVVKNIKGKGLSKKYEETVTFEDLKPEISLVGKGVILPGTDGLLFPFDAVGVNAVDVKIFKIYENNISQFLQVNDLEGNYQLSRVGKVVCKKTIKLQQISTSVTNFGKKTRYYLNLADLIEAEPGAIYQVSLGIRKAYSTYANCSDGEEADDLQPSWDEETEEDEDYVYTDSYGYDYYYDDYDYYDYDWRERDDPCSQSYYSNKTVSRNVLATDIGIIAKIGTSGEMNVFTVNLITAEPISGCAITLLDYQSQELYRASTNSDGNCMVQLKKAPYLLIAKNGKQRSYLKLTGGSSLSQSNFEVDGTSVRKGIKGFLYGERGVWRPGDSIFLSFILEDNLNKLSPETPVVLYLINPRGQKMQTLVKSKSVNGFYDFRTATDANALTGNWTANIKVGGSVFSKTLKIETIKPNRLKINLDFGSEKLDNESKGTLTAAWLHGATAQNLKADITMVLNKTNTVFPSFATFYFDDPGKRFYSETYKIFDGTLDTEGKAEFNPELSIDNSSPGVLKANFETRVFEQGGEFSVDRFSLNYYPYTSYLGIKIPEGENISQMLYTNINHTIKFVNVTREGKLFAKNKIKVDIYKVNWRWWWDRSSDDVADFVRGTYNEPYSSFNINTTQGMGQFSVNIPDTDYGRYYIRLTDSLSGHSTGKIVYFDWPGWASRTNEGKEASTMLIFSADKEKYKVGDEVKLNIPGYKGARILISLETGSKVLKSYWVNSEAGNTAFSFKVTPEMAPNIYVNATLIQPHGQTVNDMPIRLYGIVPIYVEDPKTHLRPVITMKDVIRPEENASITVKEENGKPMTYTIAVVDEGLLDITKFKTPDPWNYFYAKEALGVKSWDLYDMVMGAYGGQMDRILSIGGDDDGSGGKGAKRANRFKPMVKFFGPFAVSGGKSKTHTFMMPQYVGSVRVMVIAGQDGAYGASDKTVAVRKPLMLLATLPRVVGSGETVTLPVSVFAMEKFVKNATVTVTTNNMFTIKDKPSKQITFKEIGDQLVAYQLQVKETIGIGKVSISAKSGNETARYDIEIDVRNPNSEVVEVLSEAVSAGNTWSTQISPVGMVGTNNTVLEVSSIPPLNLEKRLRYLVTYPYGCVEQTTSAAFPQLYLADLMDLEPAAKNSIEKNIKSAIQRLNAFSSPSGGMAYWPGGSEPDEWGTNYAGHFLLEAKNKGYTISTSLMEKWKKYQRKKALEYSPTYTNYYYNYDLVQAYRLYTLALAKAPELGAMNLLKEQANLSVQAKWRLAAAYKLAGQDIVARRMVEKAETTIKPYRELFYSYGSDDRDKAMIIEALTLLDLKMKAAPLVKSLSQELCKNTWYSTQTTAYSLMAISKFVGNSGASSGLNFTYAVNNAAAVTKKTSKSICSIDITNLVKDKKGSIKVNNLGKSILFVRIARKGIPAIGQENAAANSLSIEVVYKSMEGNVINPSRLVQGTDFYAEVSVSNPGLNGYYYNMALSQVFPSGWEIHNTRMDLGYGRVENSPFDYQDFRDDRVYTFFGLPGNQKRTYKVLLNASYLGKFYLPTVNCSAMYDEGIYARTKGMWVEVVSEEGVLTANTTKK